MTFNAEITKPKHRHPAARLSFREPNAKGKFLNKKTHLCNMMVYLLFWDGWYIILWQQEIALRESWMFCPRDCPDGVVWFRHQTCLFGVRRLHVLRGMTNGLCCLLWWRWSGVRENLADRSVWIMWEMTAHEFEIFVRNNNCIGHHNS